MKVRQRRVGQVTFMSGRGIMIGTMARFRRLQDPQLRDENEGQGIAPIVFQSVRIDNNEPITAHTRLDVQFLKSKDLYSGNVPATFTNLTYEGPYCLPNFPAFCVSERDEPGTVSPAATAVIEIVDPIEFGGILSEAIATAFHTVAEVPQLARVNYFNGQTRARVQWSALPFEKHERFSSDREWRYAWPEFTIDAGFEFAQPLSTRRPWPCCRRIH